MNAAADIRFRRYDVICNRYEVIQELGVGGMATVILARDLQLERRVAIKLLRTDDLELRQRLFNEARITVRCQHDHIVVVYEADVYNGWPYIVLEHLSGRPLSALVEVSRRLPYTQAIGILVPVLQALQHIHALGIVHRDIKPDNVFITESGVIKLLDFGIAKVLEPSQQQAGAPGQYIARPPQEGMVTSSQLTRVGTILGTLPYMSPEQWGIGVEIDQQSDLWACGILLFELICGRHPLHPRQGNELIATALLDTPMPSMLGAAPPEVPRELSIVVDRCLAKGKQQRWQSASELLAALRRFLPAGTPREVAAAPHQAPTRIVPMPPHPAGAAGADPGDVVANDARTVPHEPVGAQAVAASAPANDALPPILHLPAQQPATVIQPERKSLLFVAANPAGAVDGTTGRTTHRIREELERSIARDRFELLDCPAPETLDLLRLLRRHRPVLVYFAGGDPPAGERRAGQALFGKGGVWLRRDGKPQLVAPTSLQEMFEAAGSSVKLVVLDRAFTKLLADALLAHVDCVVGTPGTASPDLAEAYAAGLFGAIGDCESLATAHKHACAAVSLEGLAGDERPQIKVRRGVDAGKLVLAR